MTPLLTINGLKKSFGSVAALRDLSFELYPGEVVALLGDNGAGKSTAVKIISGLYRPDSGLMRLNGRDIDWRKYDVRAARRLGVETVYQERSLAERQPLWRNFFLGRNLKNRWGLIDVPRQKREAMKVLGDFLGLKGAGLDPDACVASLSGGERQGLAIARAVYFESSVVLLDEPTTALAVGEVNKVAGFVDGLRSRGTACLLVCHDLSIVERLADRYLLMEHGRLSACWRRGEISMEGLAHRLAFGEKW
ncbi:MULTISPECIES: ATP-binding cassette domain-containing protein [Jonquetella]|uniref:ATP-binding cassette domain-containing protein n=1 Tax=Jonquetella TaxID=428711 RepID=UPI0003AE4AF3|nr:MULTISPECIES: ATP-binding cassette domain-containing protein [Jonquetella]ERL24603.1 ABC transporter, ATP-binding protein [Jonquetella sp. BV3C21]